MGTYDNSYSGSTGAVPGNPGVVPSPLTNNSSGVTPLTVSGTGNNTGGYSTIRITGSNEVIAPYVAITDYSDEIQKRDDKIEEQNKRIMELEEKLTQLTNQVSSMLNGSNEVIDDNITTERIKKLFEE